MITIPLLETVLYYWTIILVFLSEVAISSMQINQFPYISVYMISYS